MRGQQVWWAVGLIASAVVVSSQCAYPAQAKAKAKATPNVEELRVGKSFIPTKVYTEEEDQKIIELFKGLRVADVVDGMDSVGLHGIGLMDRDIRPLWRDTEHYTHRIIGVAVTARYVPTNKPPVRAKTVEEFDEWVGATYKAVTSEPFVPLLRKGSVLVIELDEGVDAGTIGSNNSMGWKARGCIGIVTDATARDTDEIATVRIPLYFKRPGRGIRPGRNEIESVNRPVVVGGVLVVPGDVVVADGDGVVVVPRDRAEQVAKYALKTLEGDKASRRGHYKKLGLPDDDSVK
ncbi:RraA family protein [Candidatus Sumerlaeota bacterium]|nr:RraA family protein [Candidatus Sumerlaeota bacterium]